MNLVFTQEEVETLPIRHMSYSGIRAYLTNRHNWKKRYIDLNYDTDISIPMLIGDAMHQALASYYEDKRDGVVTNGEQAIKKALDIADDLFSSKKLNIKGWSQEGEDEMKDNMHKDIEIALTGYFNELPDIGKVVGIEVGDKVTISYDGVEFPIPLKCIIDLLWIDEEGRLIIEDHKFVAGFEEGEDVAAFDIQAAACYFVAQAITGLVPYKMIYRQISKKLINPLPGKLKGDLVQMCIDNGIEITVKSKKDGGLDSKESVGELRELLIISGLVAPARQVVPFEIVFDERPFIIDLFAETYTAILNEIYLYTKYDGLRFLCNPFDRLTGQTSYNDYILDVTGIDVTQPKEQILDF